MNSLLEFIRKTFRLLAALIIWANGLFLFDIPRPPVAAWAARINLNAAESSIVFLLLFLSILASYGIRRFAVDLAYIYFFPFVLLWYISRLGFYSLRALSKLFDFGEEDEKPEQAKAIVVKPSEASDSKTIRHIEGKLSFGWKETAASFLRPFLKFTPLWCLLLLLSSKRFLVWIALVIVLFHLVRTLIRVLRLAAFSIKWLSQLEEKIREYAESLISKVLSIPRGAQLTIDLRNAVSALVAFRVGVELLQNKKRVVQWVFALGLLAFGAIYCYLGLLFAFAYYGIARVQTIALGWTEALVTSLFIPVAFGELPKNVWLKLAGGIQWLFVVLLGFGTVFGFIQKKFDSLSTVAESLGNRLKAEEIRSRIEELEREMKSAASPTQGNNPSPK